MTGCCAGPTPPLDAGLGPDLLGAARATAGADVYVVPVQRANPQFTWREIATSVVLLWLIGVSAAAAIPAPRLMTVYAFNGPSALPYYDAGDFARHGARSPAGSLAQGSAVIPCLVVRGGAPLTDAGGAPYVGFEVVVDAARAAPDDALRFEQISDRQKALRVADHVCTGDVRHVIDARRLFALDKAPRFEPPPAAPSRQGAAPRGELDEIVRAFHSSRHCGAANRRLLGRRDALDRAWDAFAAEGRGRWPAAQLARARHLDYVMRTALYEGHVGRGCSAYGGCERNVIALSIRNRAVERCLRGQGCSAPGDFQGVASSVSQYNIWDEVLTQTSGLTSCFLRPDVTAIELYAKLQAMYEQSVADVERVLFGGDADLRAVFPGNGLDDLKTLRHYYHPPAMGACFPSEPRIEYISAAVARRDAALALIVNTRVHVDAPRGNGYLFRLAKVDQRDEGDVVTLADDYAGFVLDGRKVTFQRPSRCAPYGTPSGCRFERVGRHRKTPSWLNDGRPLQLRCRIAARGEDCKAPPAPQPIEVGGVCDTLMQPMAGVR
jgi:hypothetical protein